MISRNVLILFGVSLFGAACTHPQSAAPSAPATRAPAAAANPLLTDPSVSDGDKYHLLFENECVRLLRYHDQAAAKTHLHHHPDFILYALGPFRRRLTFPDGSTREREFRAGDVAFMKAQDHIGENIGAADTDSLLIELKPCAPRHDR